MILRAAFVILFSLCSPPIANAQEAEVPLPGLDQDDFYLTEMLIKVRVEVDGLIEQANTVVVNCFVFGAGEEMEAVGTGQLWLYRESAPVTGASRSAESFEGSSINKVVSVPIVAFEPHSQAINYWHGGKCALQIGLDRADLDPGSIETPRLCEALNDEPGGKLACVWPDTDPEAAVISFRRPGLPDADSATDDAD